MPVLDMASRVGIEPTLVEPESTVLSVGPSGQISFLYRQYYNPQKEDFQIFLLRQFLLLYQTVDAQYLLNSKRRSRLYRSRKTSRRRQ